MFSFLAKCRVLVVLSLSLAATTTTSAFVIRSSHRAAFSSSLLSSESSSSSSSSSETNSDDSVAEPKMNPDNPALPEIPGDYDWDAKFSGDTDWTTDNVPGKTTLSELELASQATALGSLETKWRKETEQEAYEGARQIGFVERAETMNGRVAMFFLVTGLLTEYWTGVSLPGQVEEMLRIAGVIGFEQ